MVLYHYTRTLGYCGDSRKGISRRQYRISELLRFVALRYDSYYPTLGFCGVSRMGVSRRQYLISELLLFVTLRYNF